MTLPYENVAVLTSLYGGFEWRERVDTKYINGVSNNRMYVMIKFNYNPDGIDHLTIWSNSPIPTPLGDWKPWTVNEWIMSIKGEKLTLANLGPYLSLIKKENS